MGCASCSSGGGTPKGCKNNGTCSSGGCNKLEVFDWLANISLPKGQSTFDLVEVRFKNARKAFYRNADHISLQTGDVIAVDTSPGWDIGVVSALGELARIQVKKKAPNLKAMECKKILHISNQEEIDKWIKTYSGELQRSLVNRLWVFKIEGLNLIEVSYGISLTLVTVGFNF